MTKQMRYPAEAFALAMILLSGGMKEAIIVGIGLIFGNVLQCVLRENIKTKNVQALSAAGAFVAIGAIYAMLLLVDLTPTWKHAILALFLIKHGEDSQQDEFDYNRILLADAVAYGLYVLFSLIKEYMSSAMIFGYELPEIPAIAKFYGKPAFTLILAGILIALVNRILKCECEKNSGLWVCIPAIFIEIPFVWNNVPEWFGTIVGIFTVCVIYVTLRGKLFFSNTEKNFRELPVETIMLGFIYMIFGLL